MITRFALFEGQVQPHDTEAFRAAVLNDVLPHWQAFPGVLDVRVCFSTERDEGAPEIPLVLAISYPDRASVDVALASPERALASADILTSLAPKSGHNVHMPGHIYNRIGDYKRAHDAFVASVKVDSA